MSRPNYEDCIAIPIKRRQFNAGVDYLMENRPLWTYLPGVNLIWKKGFALGVSTVIEMGYDVLAEDKLRARVYDAMVNGRSEEL